MAVCLPNPSVSQSHTLDGYSRPFAQTTSSRETIQVQKFSARLSMEPEIPELPFIDDCISVLQTCRKSKSLTQMGSTMMEIYGSGLDYHEELGNHLVPTLVECGKFHEAEQFFQRLEQRKEHSWTSLIQGYIGNGELDLAFTIFHEMQRDGVQPSKHTYVALLNGSSKFQNLERGQELHADISREGFELFPYVANALVDMYAKCGSLVEASDVHHTMKTRDVVTWTSLISGYTDRGLCKEALKCLQQMQFEGVTPNDVTYLCTLKACGALGARQTGQRIYANLITEGFEKKPFVASALVDMYAKFGLLVEAEELFYSAEVRDTVAWNTLIAGYAERGLGREALKCLEQMESEGTAPDVTTYACSLKACSSIRALDKGRELHAGALIQQFETNEFVGSSLVDMYAKCGALPEAQDVLEELPFREVVSWTALIAGIADCGRPKEALHALKQMQAEGISSDVVSWSAVTLGFVEQGEDECALELYSQMQEQGVAPNRVTYLSVLKACGNLSALQFGKTLHVRMNGLPSHGAPTQLVETALMNMYADCGNMKCAADVFDRILMKDQVSWNAFIKGHVRQGNSKSVFYLNERAKVLGMKEDNIALANILTVCTHAGTVEIGEVVFESMTEFPDTQHQNCMVNLFCQAGQLDKVVAMLNITPLPSDSVTWATLLGACQKWGDLNLGSWIVELAMKAVPEEAVSFISLCNIILDAHNWFDE